MFFICRYRFFNIHIFSNVIFKVKMSETGLISNRCSLLSAGAPAAAIPPKILDIYYPGRCAQQAATVPELEAET